MSHSDHTSAGSGSTTTPRTVLVTGASSGIGLACARAFLERGDRVVLHYRRQADAAEALVAEFGSDVARTIGADLATEQGCIDLVTGCAQCFGAPHVLVHSAGIWNPGPIAELSRDRLEGMFRLNTFAAYYLSREMVRSRECAASSATSGTPTGGSIIVIGSTAGQRGEPAHSHYAGSKAALWGLVQSLAQELAPTIRVNLVSPGWVRTPMAAGALAEAGREQRIRDRVPLRRIAEPEDIAQTVLFLADDVAARHLTGIDLSASGGALLPMPRD
jgi:3-oxoacyl-[acyl-carrier protein] reductase